METLALGPVNPKLEILKSLMWDMGYEICAGTRLFAHGLYLTSQTHIAHPRLKKGIATLTYMTAPTGRGFSQ